MQIKKHYTSRNEVKVYDDRGTHKSTILVNGTEVVLAGAKDIPGRGDCFRISAPFAGYVLKNYVREVIVELPDDPGEDDPGDPSNPVGELPMFLRGFDGSGLPIPGAVWKKE